MKNSMVDPVPHSVELCEVEGSHHSAGQQMPRSLLRLNAVKIAELVSWNDYAAKFYLAMELLAEYELSSRRSRSRMKNVVSMLGEKVKALNVTNLTSSELIVK